MKIKLGNSLLIYTSKLKVLHTCLGIVLGFISDHKPEHLNTNIISPLGHQQYLTSADTRQKNVSATEGLNIEIIERPKELKVFVKKMPMKKQSPKGGVINKLKKLGEIINKVKLKSTDGANLNEGEKMRG